MFGKKDPRPVGAIGGGLPYEDLEQALTSPDSVRENLEKMRPMIQALRVTAQTEGWKKYIQPFLDKQKNPAELIKLVKEGKDARAEVGKMEAYTSLSNLMGSALRTGESLDKIDRKEAQDALGAEEG